MITHLLRELLLWLGYWRKSNDNAWWGVGLREPCLTAVENRLLLYLDSATMAVDSDREH